MGADDLSCDGLVNLADLGLPVYEKNEKTNASVEKQGEKSIKFFFDRLGEVTKGDKDAEALQLDLSHLELASESSNATEGRMNANQFDYLEQNRLLKKAGEKRALAGSGKTKDFAATTKLKNEAKEITEAATDRKRELTQERAEYEKLFTEKAAWWSLSNLLFYSGEYPKDEDMVEKKIVIEGLDMMALENGGSLADIDDDEPIVEEVDLDDIDDEAGVGKITQLDEKRMEYAAAVEKEKKRVEGLVKMAGKIDEVFGGLCDNVVYGGGVSSEEKKDGEGAGDGADSSDDEDVSMKNKKQPFDLAKLPFSLDTRKTFLSSLIKLNILNLRDCNLHKTSIGSILETIAEKNIPVTALCLDANPALGDSGMLIISQFLSRQNEETIQRRITKSFYNARGGWYKAKLDEDSLWGKFDVKKLEEEESIGVSLPITQHPCQLETISLQNIGMTDEGFCSIVAAVARAPKSLVSVDVRGNLMVEMDTASRQIAVNGNTFIFIPRSPPTGPTKIMSSGQAQAMSVPLTENTEEYGLVEYFLQLSCRTSLVKIRSLWELNIPTVRQHFEARTSGSLILPCWLPISQLDHMNSVQEVCQRGFKIDEAGLLCQVGNFALPGVFQEIEEMDNPDEEGMEGVDMSDPNAVAIAKAERQEAAAMRSKARFLAGGKRLFEVFLCHVGVGKSQLVTPENSDAFENLDTSKLLSECPHEFDSVYLHRKKKKLFQDIHGGIAPQHTFQHDYLIREHSQILPVFLVHFELDTTKQDSLLLSVCDSCQTHPAVVWCESDAAKLCQECDTELHSLNKIVARHIRTPIFEMPRFMGECSLHQGQEVYQFCATCQEFLCNVCLTAGSHSTPETLRTHTIIPLQEAYRTAIRSSSNADARVAKQREVIRRTLSQIEDFVQQATSTGKAAEDRLYGLIQETLVKCQTLTEGRVQKLLSDEIDIKRQLLVFEWTDRFLKQQMLELSPPDFLNTWARHNVLRRKLGELFDFHHGDAPERAVDLQLAGGIKCATMAPP